LYTLYIGMPFFVAGNQNSYLYYAVATFFILVFFPALRSLLSLLTGLQRSRTAGASCTKRY